MTSKQETKHKISAPKTNLTFPIHSPFPTVGTAGHWRLCFAPQPRRHSCSKHFRAWCNLRDLPVDHSNSWREYAKTIIHSDYSGKPYYSIAKVDYSPDIIASLLRFVSHSPIMGCSFDTDEEVEGYSQYLDEKASRVERGEDHFTPIEEAIDLLCSDITHQDPVRPPEPDFPTGGRNDA